MANACSGVSLGELAHGRIMNLQASLLSLTVAQTTANQVVATWILPCDARILKLDYHIVAANSYDIAGFEVTVEEEAGTAVAIGTSVTITKNVTTQASWSPTREATSYKAGSVVKVICDGHASGTEAWTNIALGLTISPTVGG